MRGSDGWGPPCHSDTDFVEMDPSGRYGRYHEVLGKGASKVVYKAFDSVLGMEVAWNQIKIDNTNSRPEDMERLYAEVALLQTLKHKNVMRFHASWVNAEYGSVNFITEMFTSGTLREYRQKHRHADITAIKHWARQILHGLAYLHSQDPPVVHRDIKCDNIFVNGHLGEVKIGDLGFATILTENLAAHCVIGTPEFMAPELYSQEYNELVDVYAFGMCLLELLTFEYPYSECFKPAQIFKKVTSGVKPEALYKITDPDARQFVEKCLSAVSARPSARDLLLDPFLSNDYLDSLDIFCSLSNVDDYEFIESEQIENLGYRRLQLMDSFHGGRNDYGNSPGTRKSLSTSSHRGQNLIITGSRSEDNEIYLRVRIAYKGKAKNIHFPFDIESDTPMTVAEEMVTELEITDHDVHEIADMINKAVSSLIVDEERKLMVERDEAGEVIHSEYKMGGNDFMLSPASSENSFFNYFMVPNLLNKQTGMAKSSRVEDAVHGSSEQVLNQRKKIDVPIMAKEKQKTSAESLDLYQDADEWFDQELHCPPYSPISSCSEDVKFLPYNESHSDLGSYYTKCISSSTNSASNSQSACQLQLPKETHETVPQCSISTHSTSQNASISEGIHCDLECEGFSPSARMSQHRNLLPSNILDKHDDSPFENGSRLRVSTSKKELKELQTRLRYLAHGSRDNLLMEKLPSSFCTGSKVSFLSKERRPNRIMMKNLKSFQKLNEEQLERWYRDWKAAYEGLPRRGSHMAFPSSNKITSNLNALEPINFSRNQRKFPMGFAHSLSEREKLMGKRRLTKNYSFNDLRGSSNLKSIAADLSKLRLYHTVGTVNSEKVRANENTS